MQNNSLSKVVVIFLVGIIALIYLANKLIRENQFPSLNEFLASTSTPKIFSGDLSNTSSSTDNSGSVDKNDVASSSIIEATSSIGVSSNDAAVASSSIAVDTTSASTSKETVENDSSGGLRVIPIRAPLGTIRAMIADSTESQEKGLGDRASLAKNAGMLFIFNVPGDYGFWMKDMSFPIDMVWVNRDKTVVGIARNVATSSFPGVFDPPSPIIYVLELNANASKRLGIATGTKLLFN